jgi:AcrR family transcriptional regulator
MINRNRLLEAAARVYAEAGFRGATTRRIAEEAGVNEVTIFRLFGSKAALLAEAMQTFGSLEAVGIPALPAVPADPERELTRWCSRTLEFLRRNRSIIRKSLAEVEELPEMGAIACEGCVHGQKQLREYAAALQTQWKTSSVVDGNAAVAMLLGALFADAMTREMTPDSYPQPPQRAAAAYVRVFLRALGVSTDDPVPARKSRIRFARKSA